MENGSSDQRHTINIPLPTDMPSAPDLTGLPDSVLQTGVVESLLSHVDDLSSRLAVQLRRYSMLENTTNTLVNERDVLKQKNASLKDEILIREEKYNRVQMREDQKLQTQEDFKKVETELREKIQVLEMQAAEVLTTSQSRSEDARKRIDALVRRLGRHLRYRNRVNLVTETWRGKIHKQAGEWQKLAQEIVGLETQREELRGKIREQVEYIAVQGRKTKDDQTALVQKYESDRTNLIHKYESQIRTLTSEAKDLQSRYEEISRKFQQNELLREENIKLENQLIFVKRRDDEKRLKWEDEITELQKNLQFHRVEHKKAVTELEAKTKDLVEAQVALSESRQQLKTVQEHTENLEVLWRETSARSEKDEDKVRSLQKLNQQLSEKLNEYRREILSLKSSLQELPSLDARPIQVGSRNQLVKDEGFEPESMNKIDQLLNEIQAGASSRP